MRANDRERERWKKGVEGHRSCRFGISNGGGKGVTWWS